MVTNKRIKTTESLQKRFFNGSKNLVIEIEKLMAVSYTHLSGKVKDLEIRSRSESESEQGDKSEGVDAKPSDLPLYLIHI